MDHTQRKIHNGYVYLKKDPSKHFDYGNIIQEHIVVAEEQVIDRPLKEGEVVHHLDENRANNSPDNLLVLSAPMHGKLHSWLNKNNITPTEEYSKQINTGCVRCRVCEKPINFGSFYCSEKCKCDSEKGSGALSKKYTHPTKEELQELVLDKPTTKIAEQFGVSDKAIEKLCKKLGVEKPPRGYWTKLQNGVQMLAW